MKETEKMSHGDSMQFEEKLAMKSGDHGGPNLLELLQIMVIRT